MPKTLTSTDRKSLIRLASSMEKGSPERRVILAGLSKIAAPVARVITYGGRSSDVSVADIQKMLDDKSLYKNADNLPKWLAEAKIKGIGRGMKGTWAFLERLVQHKGAPVTINVDSGERHKNGISGMKLLS